MFNYLKYLERKRNLMSLKLFIALVVVICLVFAEISALAAKVTITHWMLDTRPADKQGVNTTIKRFEELNPNIKVKIEYTPWDVAFQKTRIAAAAGTLPDTGRMYWIDEFSQYLQPLESFITLDYYKSISKFNWIGASVYEDGKIKILAVPWYSTTYGLFYNRKMLEEVGLDRAPQTANELLGYAKVLTKDTNGDGIIDQWGITFPVARSGAHFVPLWAMEIFGAHLIKTPQYSESNSPEPITLCSKEAVEGFDWYTKFQKERLMPPDTPILEEPRSYFYAENVAMTIDGAWEVSRAKEVLGENLGVAELPSGPRGKFAIGYTGRQAMFKTSQHKEAAWKWLKFITSPEGQHIWFRINGFMPSVKEVQKDEFYTKDPFYEPFMKMFQYADAEIPIWMGKARSIFDQEWIPVMQKALYGKIESEEAVKQMEKALEEGLAEYYPEIFK